MGVEPGRTEGVRKIAARFGVDPGTVQRIGRPFDGASVVALAEDTERWAKVIKVAGIKMN